MKVIDDFLQNNKKRIVGLDILRSIAILIVVYGHGISQIPDEYHKIYNQLLFIKIDGVSIFFVLSGFLIGRIILKLYEKEDLTRYDFYDFWIRRWFRTLPNYFLVLSFLVLYKILVFDDLQDFNLKYLLFSQNLVSPHPSFFPEAWSLAVEEWFYLTLPIVMFLFYLVSKNKAKSLLIATLLFITFPLILRIYKFEANFINLDIDESIRKVVIYRLDSMMYGIIGSYIDHYYHSFWYRFRRLFLFLGALLLTILSIDSLRAEIYPPIYFNLESITALCFLPFLANLKTTKVRFLDFIFVFISIISYSMYLLNLSPIQGHLLPVLEKYIINPYFFEIKSLITYVVYWGACIIGSYVIYYNFEIPMTNLRDKVVLLQNKSVKYSLGATFVALFIYITYTNF